MLSGQVEPFLGLGYFSSVRFVPYYVGMEAMLGFAQEGAEQLNAFYAVWESMGFLPEEFGEQQQFFFLLLPLLPTESTRQYICLPS